MKISIYMAITLDGYIATKDDDTSWVSKLDWSIFRNFVKEKKVIVMGRKTWEVSGTDFPYGCDLNIVMTRNKKLINEQNNIENVLFTDIKPTDIVKYVEKFGYKELLLIGGSEINSMFLSQHLVDEIYVDIHPIVIGNGIKLLNELIAKTNLKLIETRTIMGKQVVLRYRVRY